MNILLFGGSFDPPHLGHELVTTESLKLINDVDEIWLLPTYNHSFAKQLISPHHRLEMLSLYIKYLAPKIDKPLKVCPIEIDYQTSGSTYETINLLQSETEYLAKSMFPQSLITNHQPPTFSFLMGSDQLHTFHTWEHHQELLEKMHFFVYPRAHYQHSIDFPNMSLLQSDTQIITNLSSTLIKHRLLEHLPINHLLIPEITQYISDHRLYRQV